MSVPVMPNRPVEARHRVIVPAADGVAIDTIVEGAGPAIVLLPSLGRDSEDYGEVATGLAGRGFKVLRPQPRGLGASRGPMTGITLRDLAADVAGVIAAQADGPAIVVGHAFGNWVARMLASAHPEAVRGVVVAAAAARTYAPELTENIRRIVDPRVANDVRLDLLRRTFFAAGSDPSVWLDGWHGAVRDSQFAASRATPQKVWWEAGRAPILELQAAEDPFMPAINRGDLARELGPRVTTVLVEGASHALMPERPGRVVEAVVEWSRNLPVNPYETIGHTIDI